MWDGFDVGARDVSTCVKLCSHNSCKVATKKRWWVDFVFCDIVYFDSSDVNCRCNRRSVGIIEGRIVIEFKRWRFRIRCRRIRFVAIERRGDEIIRVEHSIMRHAMFQWLNLQGIELINERTILSCRHDFGSKGFLKCPAIMSRILWAAFFL